MYYSAKSRLRPNPRGPHNLLGISFEEYQRRFPNGPGTPEVIPPNGVQPQLPEPPEIPPEAPTPDPVLQTLPAMVVLPETELVADSTPLLNGTEPATITEVLLPAAKEVENHNPPPQPDLLPVHPTPPVNTDLFQAYIGLGPLRSFELLAHHLQLPLATIRDYATKENWEVEIKVLLNGPDTNPKQDNLSLSKRREKQREAAFQTAAHYLEAARNLVENPSQNHFSKNSIHHVAKLTDLAIKCSRDASVF